ncbi:hypothetical protein Btru_046640 [Bulinus truncatus]|nr:hypothetical protein Btru_046640 [Bulinus truncatus]
MSFPKEKSRPLSHQSETYGCVLQPIDKQQEAEIDSFCQKVNSCTSQDFNEKPMKLMTNELKEYWKRRLPFGFQFYLERLAQSIIRHQPENIIKFAALYFEKVYSIKNAEISNLPKESYFVKLFKKNLSEAQRKKKQHWRPELEVETCHSEPLAESDGNLSFESQAKPVLTSLALTEETEGEEVERGHALDKLNVLMVETQRALISENHSDQCKCLSYQGNSMKTEMADIIHSEILRFMCSPDIVASCHPTEVIKTDPLPNESENTGSNHVKDRPCLAQEISGNHCSMSESTCSNHIKDRPCLAQEISGNHCSMSESTGSNHVKDRPCLAQEISGNHCSMNLSSYNSSAYLETNDMYIAQTYSVHGMLHETKYYQNGSVAEDGSLGSVDARGDQLTDYLLLETERKVTLTDDKDVNYLKHSLVISPPEQQNQGSRYIITEDVSKYEAALEEEHSQDCPAFISPWQSLGNRRLKTDAVMNELVSKKESFLISSDSFLKDTHMNETSFINANFCHVDEKFMHNQMEERFPASLTATRNSQTDEDSIGEDIQSRFRAEQNTYFIPIRSESELTKAGWDVANDESTLAHGENVFGEAAAAPSPKNCSTREEDLKLYGQYGDQNEASVQWNESSVVNTVLEDAQSCIVYDAEEEHHQHTYGTENSVACSIGKNENSGYRKTKDSACIADNYICELKSVSQNIEKLIDEQILRDSDTIDSEMSGKWACHKTQLEKQISNGSREGGECFTLHALGRDNVTCSKYEECFCPYYAAEKLGLNVTADENDSSSHSEKKLLDYFDTSFQGLGHISEAFVDHNVEEKVCFGSSLNNGLLLNEGGQMLESCENTNNNGNTGSTYSSEIKSGDAMSSSKTAREGVIIYEKDPGQKGAQIDFLILEGNQIFSIPNESIVRNTWRDYYKPCNVNNSKTDESTESELAVDLGSQDVHGWQVTGEHSNETCDSSLLEEFTCDCLPKPCSSSVSAKSTELKPQVLTASNKKRDEFKTRKVVPITRICTQLSQPKTSYESGANKTYEKQQSLSPCSPMFYSPRQRSPESITFSPKTFNQSSPKSRSYSPKSPKNRTFGPKSPKSRTFSPKSPKTRTFSHKSPKPIIFSPKLAKPKTFSSKSPKLRTFSPNSPKPRNFSPKSPKLRTFSLKSPKSRVFSPNSSNPRAFSPKLPKSKQRQNHSPTIKVKGSSSHDKVQKKKVLYSHDHIGASYILQPRGISYSGKKTKSWTEVNKPPTKKSPISIALPSRVKKPQGTGSKNSKKSQSKKKQDSTFPLSLHTFYDPCSATSCYIPETTRQLTIESPKENLMVHTTYVRPNPLQPNIRGIFELISKKQRLYLGDNERAISSDETRQLICETECFVTRDSKTKHLILENGTLSDPAPKVVTRSFRSVKKLDKSVVESKSETKNVSNLTSGKNKPKKRPWADHNYVELIGDFVYIGRQGIKYPHKQNEIEKNKNINALVDSFCSESLCQVGMGFCCDHMIDCSSSFGGSNVNHLADSTLEYFSHNASVNRDAETSHIFDLQGFYSSWKYGRDPSSQQTVNDGLKYNINNNSAAELTSDLEDTTLQDIDQIITEHPQLNSLKHKPSRRSRPNSPSKRSVKGKCLECEPSVTGDVEQKHFLDFKHQVHATEINASDEAQTGSSLETRANVLPLRNKSIKMGHKRWNPCMCEPPRPYVSPQYAECSIQLNLEDICCSTASQTGDGHERTYTGHAVDIDHITMCECQRKNKSTRKRHFDTQVHADEICPSNPAQTGSSLLLLDPLSNGPNEDSDQGVKTGHAFKSDYSDCEQLGKCAKPEVVECGEIETQVMATDINPCADAQTGSSLMLTDPFPPIKPTMSDEEYPEEDVTWGDLSIYDMPSENKSVFAYYKRYEDITKLEKDYEIYAKPYRTAAHPQGPSEQKKNTGASDGKVDDDFHSVGLKPEVQKIMSINGLDSREEYKQYIPTYYHEPGEIRDHEQGEFRNVGKRKESVTVTSFTRHDSLDPTLRGPRKEKYTKFKQNVLIEDMKSLSDEDEGQVEDENTKEDTQETKSHKPYRRRRKPTSGPSIETQTIKTSRTSSHKQED